MQPTKVIKLIRQGGCSDLDCILMIIDQRYVGQPLCLPTSNHARTILRLQHWLRMGYHHILVVVSVSVETCPVFRVSKNNRVDFEKVPCV